MQTLTRPSRAPWDLYRGLNGGLAMLGWCLMLFDSLWGAVGVLGGMALMGWPWRAEGIALAVALVSGLPAYILDLRIDRRTIIFLPALLAFRWFVPGLLATPRYLGSPWHGSVLLITASILLQVAKLQRFGRV